MAFVVKSSSKETLTLTLYTVLFRQRSNINMALTEHRIVCFEMAPHYCPQKSSKGINVMLLQHTDNGMQANKSSTDISVLSWREFATRACTAGIIFPTRCSHVDTNSRRFYHESTRREHHWDSINHFPSLRQLSR